MEMKREELEFIRLHRKENVNELLLHNKGNPTIDMKVVARQIIGWQKARLKLPLWAEEPDITYPDRLPLEQCSSQTSAEYKSFIARRFFQGSNNISDKNRAILITDLTGGFGVDATMITRGFVNSRLTFVEQNSELCHLAEHNFPLLGITNPTIINNICENVIPQLPHQDIIYIDPARRDIHGNKTVKIEDCTPNLTKLYPTLLNKADVVLAKLSPMLDITDAIRKMSGLTEVHIISINGECKEILLVMSSLANMQKKNRIKIVCTNLGNTSNQEFAFYQGDEQSAVCPLSPQVMKYLYEPNASVMKSGAFKSIGERFGLSKLHRSSHLYTSDNIVSEFPGRIFVVEQTFNMSKNDIKSLQQKTSQANITTRNFPLSVSDLRRRLKIQEGGDYYIFATTLSDNSHALLLCKKADQ